MLLTEMRFCAIEKFYLMSLCCWERCEKFEIAKAVSGSSNNLACMQSFDCQARHYFTSSEWELWGWLLLGFWYYCLTALHITVFLQRIPSVSHSCIVTLQQNECINAHYQLKSSTVCEAEILQTVPAAICRK